MSHAYDITNYYGWIRIWASHHQSQCMNKNIAYAYDITNHNGWIRLWTMNMISPITMDKLEYHIWYHQSQWMN